MKHRTFVAIYDAGFDFSHNDEVDVPAFAGEHGDKAVLILNILLTADVMTEQNFAKFLISIEIQHKSFRK